MKNRIWMILILLVCHIMVLMAIPMSNSHHIHSRKKLSSTITVGQFLSINFDRLDQLNLIKLNWVQKTILKSTQHRLKSKLNKGKINTNDQLLSQNSKNTRGLLSLIFGGAGFLFLFLGPLAFLSLPLGIAGLVLGIISIKKEEKDTMGIIGLIFGSLVILLFLLVIIWLAAFFSVF